MRRDPREPSVNRRREVEVAQDQQLLPAPADALHDGQARAAAAQPPLEAVVAVVLVDSRMRLGRERDPVGGHDLRIAPAPVLQHELADAGRVARRQAQPGMGIRHPVVVADPVGTLDPNRLEQLLPRVVVQVAARPRAIIAASAKVAPPL